MCHDEDGFVPVLIQDKMHSAIEARMGLIGGFSSKNKLARLLKELTDRALKSIMGKKWHMAPIMFVQIGESLHLQLKMNGKDVSRFPGFRLSTGDNDFRCIALQ